VIGCGAVGEESRGGDELPRPRITAWVCSNGMISWGEHCGSVVAYIRFFLNTQDGSFRAIRYNSFTLCNRGDNLKIRVQIQIKIEHWLRGFAVHGAIRIGRLSSMRLRGWRWRYRMSNHMHVIWRENEPLTPADRVGLAQWSKGFLRIEMSSPHFLLVWKRWEEERWSGLARQREVGQVGRGRSKRAKTLRVGKELGVWNGACQG